MSTELHTPLFLRPDVVATVVENGAVLLDLQTKYFYSANASAWAMLQLFETGASAAQVIEKVQTWSAGSAQTPETVKQEAAAAIDYLVQEALINADGATLPGSDVSFEGTWSAPKLEKHREPLQRIMTSAFDPTMPLSE